MKRLKIKEMYDGICDDLKLMNDDILDTYNGITIDSHDTLMNLMEKYKGETHTLRYIRGNTTHSVKLTAGKLGIIVIEVPSPAEVKRKKEELQRKEEESIRIKKESLKKEEDTRRKKEEELLIRKNEESKKNKETEFPNNYDKYNYLTITNNWKAICELNGINFDSYGTKKEFNVLPDYLEDEEVVFAIASGIMSQTSTSNSFDWGPNTWLVVLTSERFLFLDHALMSTSVDTQSVRHDNVQAVSASQGMIFGKIQIDLGSRVIVIDNCKKEDVKVIAALANKWYRKIQFENKNSFAGSSPEFTSQMQESIKLAKIQIMNQKKIISLLEQLNEKVIKT